MEKILSRLNEYCLKSSFFFKSHKRINPFENKFLFCLFPVFIGIFCAIHYRAMYQTCDDAEMRFVLDGTLAGGHLEKPSEFSLYMSTTYGKFLKFFYSIDQNLFWYDFFTYLFVCVSVFVITLSCCYDFEKTSVFKKVCVLITISLVGSTAFVSPQFTITSGLLAVSGVLSFYMLTKNFFEERKQKILCAFYCIFSLFFSSIIRFENCMIVSFFTGIALLPLWPYHDWKEMIRKSVIIIFALVFIMAGWGIDYILVNNNPEWKSLRQANVARVEITDKTEMWNDIYNPWKDAEEKVDQLSQNGYTFSKGDYRLLLSFSPFGNKPAFATDNLIKASKELAPKVQTVNSIRSGFRIKDYRHVFPSFLALFFLLAFFSKRCRKSFFVIASFFILVIALNCFFRALPYRLWFNFAFAVSIVLLMLLREDISFKGYKNALSFLFLSALTLCSYTVMHNQAISTRNQYKIFSKIRKGTSLLSSKNVYLTNYSFGEHSAAPFSENIFYRRNLAGYGGLNQSRELMMKRHRFSETDTWLDICSKDSKVRFLASDWIYNPYVDIKKAVSYFIKEKYGKNVVFKRTDVSNNLYTIQCRILTDYERGVYDDYVREIIEPYHNQYARFEFAMRKSSTKKTEAVLAYLKMLDESPHIWPIFQMEFARKHLGPKASVKDLKDFIDLMDAEKTDWGYFYEREKK